MMKSVLGCVGLAMLEGEKACCRPRYSCFQGDQPYSDQSLRIAQPFFSFSFLFLRRDNALKVDQLTDGMMCRAPKCIYASNFPCVKDYFERSQRFAPAKTEGAPVHSLICARCSHPHS